MDANGKNSCSFVFIFICRISFHTCRGRLCFCQRMKFSDTPFCLSLFLPVCKALNDLELLSTFDKQEKGREKKGGRTKFKKFHGDVYLNNSFSCRLIDKNVEKEKVLMSISNFDFFLSNRIFQKSEK